MSTSEPHRKVLTLDAVRRSIEALQKPRIHEQFLAYLHIRKRSVEEGSLTDVEPNWSELGEFLFVEGGPPNKPYYRPISSRAKHDSAGFWLNRNIPGSYAPSSVRKVSQFMLNESGDGFSLPADHARQALEAHLRGERQPAWAFAAFFLRNYSFGNYRFGPTAADVDDLITGFRNVFRFDSAGPGSDFDTLFTTGGEPDIDWFDPLLESTSSTTNAEERDDE